MKKIGIEVKGLGPGGFRADIDTSDNKPGFTATLNLSSSQPPAEINLQFEAADTKPAGEEKEGEVIVEKKVAIIGTAKLESLNPAQREFLQSLAAAHEVDANGICVFVQTAEGFRLIEDFKMPSRANKQFEKEAPAGLYRGGVVCLVRHGKYTLAAPDERSQWFKPVPAGIARFAEGPDLTAAVRRELGEELFIITLAQVDKNNKLLRQTRFLPKGFGGDTNKNNRALGLEVQEIKEVGEISLLGLTVNETNRGLEGVYTWNISDIPLDKVTMSLNEDWFAGGNSGISVYALNPDGTIAGVFSGQQGFQKIPEYGIHETLKKYMK